MSDRWFKVQTSIVRNEKVLRLSRTHRWALIELWAAAAEDLNDGIISRTYCDKMIGKKSRNILIENGFLHWIEDDKTLQIHDYLSHQQSREKVLSTSKKRSAAGRKGGEAKAARANPGRSNLPDDERSNLPPEPASKIVPDQDQDIDTYSPKYVASPNETRVNANADTFSDGTPVPADPETRGALALVPKLPDRLPNGRRIPKQTRQQMLANLNATARSQAADQLVRQFENTLDGKLDRGTMFEVAQVIDQMFADGIDPQQIANGLIAWHQSDRLYPSQIPRFVAKAARGQPRPTSKSRTLAELAAEEHAREDHRP